MAIGLGVAVQRAKQLRSIYSVAGKVPGFTADFVRNKYPGKANFADAITFSRASNAVMTDGYGPELITNGSYSVGTDSWTTSTNLTSSVTNGVVNVSRSGSDDNKGFYQVVSTVIGKTYVLSFDTRNWSGSYIIVYRYGTGPTDLVVSDLTAVEGRNQIAFVADKSSMYIGFSTADGESFDLDDVSLREMPVLKFAPHNYFEYSEDWTNWSFQATETLAAVANSATAPDGTTTADTLTAGTGVTGGPRYFNDYRIINANEKITYRCWMKKGTGDYGYLTVRHSASNVAGAEFDLSSGTVDSTTEVGNCTLNASSITDAGNGWYLCSITVTCTASATNAVHMIGLGDGSGIGVGGYTNYAMNGENIYAWGAHLYRSDLGGMVDNPDQPTARGSYVFTTSASEYLPRIGHHVYNGSAWVNEGLLAESVDGTNLISYSNDFTQWINLNSTDTADQAISPDGTQNATSLADDATNGSHYISGPTSTITSGAVTASCYVKAGTLTWVRLRLNGTTGQARAWFNLSTGTVGTADSGGTADIQDVGNGWYRCVLYELGNTTAASNCRLQIFTQTADAQGAYAGDGSVLYVYGAQINQAPRPSSYVPTNGATATTSAETFSVSFADLPLDNNEVSFAVDGRADLYPVSTATTLAQPARIYQGSSDRLYAPYIVGDSTNTGLGRTFQQETSSGFDFVDTADNYYDTGLNIPFNSASRHGATFINLAVDGVALTADTTPTAFPVITSADMDLAYDYIGTIRTFRMWGQDLGDDGIVEATKPLLEPSLSLTFEATGTNSFVVNDWSE